MYKRKRSYFHSLALCFFFAVNRIDTPPRKCRAQFDQSCHKFHSTIEIHFVEIVNYIIYFKHVFHMLSILCDNNRTLAESLDFLNMIDI